MLFQDLDAEVGKEGIFKLTVIGNVSLHESNDNRIKQ
jgi:hypothetical protein